MKTLAEEVAEYLRANIGKRIFYDKVAEALGVSRSAVNRNCLRLVESGMLEQSGDRSKGWIFKPTDSSKRELVQQYIMANLGKPFRHTEAARSMGFSAYSFNTYEREFRLRGEVERERVRGGFWVYRMVENKPRHEPEVIQSMESCPRCGVRGCQKHSASSLTVGHVRQFYRGW